MTFVTICMPIIMTVLYDDGAHDCHDAHDAHDDDDDDDDDDGVS